MLRQTINILGRGFADLWENLFSLVLVNVLWACSFLPGIAVVVFVGGWVGLLVGLALLILLSGPVTLGLYSITSDVNQLEKIELRVFFRSCRQYYRRGWLLASLDIFFLVLAYFNINFYGSVSVSQSPLWIASILWLSGIFIWFTMQLYLWPLSVRMENFSLRGLLLNTFLATFKYPVQSIIISIAMILALILSYTLNFFTVILFGMCYYGIIGNKALSAVLRRERELSGAIEPGDITDPEAEAEALPAIFSTRNTPPGVNRRGMWPEDLDAGKNSRKRR